MNTSPQETRDPEITHDLRPAICASMRAMRSSTGRFVVKGGSVASQKKVSVSR